MAPNEEERPARGKLRADAVLLAVTVVWGSSFVVVRHALDTAPPFLLIFCRFALGAALLAPLLRKRMRSAGFWRDGWILGSLLALEMALQVSGQAGTTATNAGFLTGLAVVLTPFIAVFRTGRLPTLENGVGITLASVGFLLLTYPGRGASFQRGDLLLAASAVVFAAYMVELAERSSRHDALRLTAAQLSIVALGTGGLSLLARSPLFAGTVAGALESRPVDWHGAFPGSVLYLGFFCTFLAFLGATWAQGRMSAIHAAIILALEPVVASLLAAWFLGERPGRRRVAGAALVLAGIVVSELRLRSRRARGAAGATESH
ncbi:MAG TPA: DMT family transporter [Thermoanaerobaculia bacterium]|jgi:drug/metabolite transporter (DMT)-like permease